MRARFVLSAGCATVVLLGWSAVALPPADAAAAERPRPGVSYRPPVRAPITDRFRPPADRYGAGNRGIDYDTDPGAAVTVSAGGEVVFAGAVALDRHVVVLHADGLRTSYSFLASVQVRRGDVVAAGTVVGTSGELLHFGVRSGDTYLDPMRLLDGAAYLVPERRLRPPAPAPAPAAAERAAVVDLARELGPVSVHANLRPLEAPPTPTVQLERALTAGVVAGVLAG